MNYDAFRKEPIVEDKDLAGKSTLDKIGTEAALREEHAFKTFAPTPAIDAVRIAQAIENKPDSMGRERATGVVMADALAGFKLYPVDYAHEMQKRINKLDPNKGWIAQELKADIRTLAVQKAAVEKRGGSGERYQEEIDKKIGQLKGMAKELGISVEAFQKIKRGKEAEE